MRLGIVGFCTDSGVGREFQDAIRHLPLVSAFVLQNNAKPTRTDLLAGVRHVQSCGDLSDEKMDAWLSAERIDTVLTWETPWSWAWPALWARRNVRWNCVVHMDWFARIRRREWESARLIAPNAACRRMLDRERLKSTLLPVPVDADAVQYRQRTRADLFVSVFGYGGIHDRRGMASIHAAWKSMPVPPPLRIMAQANADAIQRVPGMEVRLGNIPSHAGLFAEGDVAVQPSRYEGVGVSLLEAQAAGIPVITTDAEPMRDLAPDLLIPCASVERLTIIGNEVEAWTIDPKALAAVVSRLTSSDVSALSERARRRANEEWSWGRWRDEWIRHLEG